MTAHRTASAATALDVRATPRKRFVQPLDEMTVADALRCYAARDHETVKLLRPPAIFSASSYSTPLTLPLGPAYLAGTLEAAGYRVELVDAIGEGILQIRKSADGRLKFQGLTTEEIIQRIGPETRVLGVSLMFSQGWVQYREPSRRSSGRTPISSSCSAASIRRRCPSTCCGTARRSTTSSSAKAEAALLQLLWRHLGEPDVAGLPRPRLPRRERRLRIERAEPARRRLRQPPAARLAPVRDRELLPGDPGSTASPTAATC